MTSANGNQNDGADIGGARPADMSLPAALDGLRVLEICDEKGQFCGKLMADNGADLIKIEPPGGEACRSFGPFLDDVPHRERSLSFWHYNTSKRGITLNLESQQGQELFRQLAASADIVLESRKPGYLESLGLGYDVLSADNPGLIMCSLTPYGQTGPWRDYASSDITQMGRRRADGLVGLRRDRRAQRPSHRARRRQLLAHRRPLRLHRPHGRAVLPLPHGRRAVHRRLHPRGLRPHHRGGDSHLPVHRRGGAASHRPPRRARHVARHPVPHRGRRLAEYHPLRNQPDPGAAQAAGRLVRSDGHGGRPDRRALPGPGGYRSRERSHRKRDAEPSS